MNYSDFRKTGAGEFSIWNNNDFGQCFYRHSGKFFKDYLNNKNYALEKTEEITKSEYLKNLSEYGKLLQKERF